MPTTLITVQGMTCQHCTGSVEAALLELDGVSSVAANLETGQVAIEQDGTVTLEVIASTIDDIGFEVS